MYDTTRTATTKLDRIRQGHERGATFNERDPPEWNEEDSWNLTKEQRMGRKESKVGRLRKC